MISANVALIVFRPDSELIIREEYLKPKIGAFFEARGITKFIQVETGLSLSPQDFMNVKFHYFYEVLLSHLDKSSESAYSVGYTISYDSSVATENCDVTGLKYSTICLASHPAFFYIFVDVQEIFAFLRDKGLRPYYD